MTHLLVRWGVGLAALSAIAAAPALAQDKGYKVQVDNCDAPVGSVTADSGITAWSFIGAKDPSPFLVEMAVRSGCFTRAASPSQADYRIAGGPLTEDEFKAGPTAFNGYTMLGRDRSDIMTKGLEVTGQKLDATEEMLDGLTERGEGMDAVAVGVGKLFNPKMVWGHVDVLDRSGTVVSRAFGKNNRSKLDYRHWNSPAVMSYNAEKTDRKSGGAMLNAFEELREVYSGQLRGPVMVATAPSMTARLPDLVKQAMGNSFGFFRQWGDKRTAITGQLGGVSEGRNGAINIVLRDPTVQGFSSQVTCSVPAAQADKAAMLNGGSMVTVVGTIVKPDSNSMTRFDLQNCQLQ